MKILICISDPNDILSLKVFTFLPFILTLGFFPFFRDSIFESNFILYDKNLKLIKKYQVIKTYSLGISWLFIGSDTYDFELKRRNQLVFKPAMQEFSKILSGTLK